MPFAEQAVSPEMNTDLQVARLRDLYAALRRTNQAILHCTQPQALFDEICRIAVEHGRFQMAMIRLLEPATNEVVPVAAYGAPLPGEAAGSMVIDASNPIIRGPADESVLQDRPSICNDFFALSDNPAWIELAVNVGFRSVGSFPFRRNEKIIGSLLLYSHVKDYFDSGLIELLEEMTDEISFAMANFEQQARRAEMEQALASSESRYRQLLELSPEAIFVHQHGKFVLLNEACVQLFGANQISDLMGKDVRPLLHPDYREISKRRVQALPMGELQTGVVEEMWVRIDGTPFHAEASASKFMYLGAPAVQVVMRDISARKSAEQLQYAQNEILSMIATGDALPDILKTLARLVDSQTERARCMIHLVNADRSHLHAPIAPSLPAGFVTAMDMMAIGPCHSSAGTAAFRREPVVTHDITSDALWAMWRSPALAEGIAACSSWPVYGKQGKVLAVLSLLYRERVTPDGKEMDVISAAANLAGIAIENKETEDRIRYLAHYDEMTALPNRSLFNQILNHAMKAAQRRQQKLCVMFLDLDRFKNINDTFGHSAGDKALQEFAGRVRNCLRENDTVARMGGDEFYVLLEDMIDGQEAAAIAEKILYEASRPFQINHQECHLSASIGIAIFPDDGTDAASLLKHADIAMYRAKTDGKNAYRFYSASKNIHSVERLALEAQLRRALENNELILHYQPKIDMFSGRICGVEALVRWEHPDLGLLPPQHFIPLAEETRLIIPLSKQLLRIACQDACIVNSICRTPIRVAVNLSARQLEDDDFPHQVQSLLKQTGLDANLLQLEITESMVMDNPQHAVEIMLRLQEMGIRLDIDDFGTGYSSLAYLKRFPIYCLKIDRSFIQDIPLEPNDTAITQAIIAMGHSMGLRVVAEGVERQEQVEALRQFGCDEYQGFYFSRPVPLDKIIQLIKQQENS